jgi:hypothetical protein
MSVWPHSALDLLLKCVQYKSEVYLIIKNSILMNAVNRTCIGTQRAVERERGGGGESYTPHKSDDAARARLRLANYKSRVNLSRCCLLSNTPPQQQYLLSHLLSLKTLTLHAQVV